MYENERTLRDHGNEAVRGDLLAIGESAIEAVHPGKTVPSHVTRTGNSIDVDGVRYDMDGVEEVYVIGAGKGSSHLVSALRSVLGTDPTDGVVVEKRGQADPVSGMEVREADHPVPDADSEAAAERVIELAERATANDLVFVCITGGASAGLVAPPDGVSLEEVASLTESMLNGGLPIHEINAVRKHVSEIKGGRLARLVHPARLVTLVIVDEVAGEPWGPTVGDATTFDDAIGVLRRRGLWDTTPESIRAHLRAGADGRVAETPDPETFDTETFDTETFDPETSGPETSDPQRPERGSSQVVVLADATDLCEAAALKAEALGYGTGILSSVLEGESREVGIVLAGIAKEIRRHERPLEPPCVLVSGGETTVTVGEDAGRGGPNQELALQFAIEVAETDGVTLLSLGTDGTDGPTEVAGGLVDDGTVTRANGIDSDFDPFEHVARHDATSALERLGDAVRTGSTGTNVMDLRLLAVR